MSLKESIKANIQGRIVSVEIKAKGDDLLALNAYVDLRIEALKEEGIVKWYKNRVDFFLVKPQPDWEPAELLIEVKRRLGV